MSGSILPFASPDGPLTKSPRTKKRAPTYKTGPATRIGSTAQLLTKITYAPYIFSVENTPTQSPHHLEALYNNALHFMKKLHTEQQVL